MGRPTHTAVNLLFLSVPFSVFFLTRVLLIGLTEVSMTCKLHLSPLKKQRKTGTPVMPHCLSSWLGLKSLLGWTVQSQPHTVLFIYLFKRGVQTPCIILPGSTIWILSLWPANVSPGGHSSPLICFICDLSPSIPSLPPQTQTEQTIFFSVLFHLFTANILSRTEFHSAPVKCLLHFFFFNITKKYAQMNLSSDML